MFACCIIWTYTGLHADLNRTDDMYSQVQCLLPSSHSQHRSTESRQTGGTTLQKDTRAHSTQADNALIESHSRLSGRYESLEFRDT